MHLGMMLQCVMWKRLSQFTNWKNNKIEYIIIQYTVQYNEIHYLVCMTVNCLDMFLIFDIYIANISKYWAHFIRAMYIFRVENILQAI